MRLINLYYARACVRARVLIIVRGVGLTRYVGGIAETVGKVSITRLISLAANTLENRECVAVTTCRHCDYASGLVRKRTTVTQTVRITSPKICSSCSYGQAIRHRNVFQVTTRRSVLFWFAEHTESRFHRVNAVIISENVPERISGAPSRSISSVLSCARSASAQSRISAVSRYGMWGKKMTGKRVYRKIWSFAKSSAILVQPQAVHSSVTQMCRCISQNSKFLFIVHYWSTGRGRLGSARLPARVSY